MGVVSAHDRSDVIAYFSAELPQGNKCGPQRPITGWTEVTTATGRSWSSDVRTNGGFDTGTGIYTTPVRGVYQCCASFGASRAGSVTSPSSETTPDLDLLEPEEQDILDTNGRVTSSVSSVAVRQEYNGRSTWSQVEEMTALRRHPGNIPDSPVF